MEASLDQYLCPNVFDIREDDWATLFTSIDSLNGYELNHPYQQFELDGLLQNNGLEAISEMGSNQDVHQPYLTEIMDSIDRKVKENEIPLSGFSQGVPNNGQQIIDVCVTCSPSETDFSVCIG